MQETFQELQATLEELHVAEEELRQQNEELDAAQQLIEAERQRYQELFDFAPEGYLVTDLHGLIREANAATLLGVSMRTLKGKPFANYIGEETRGEFRRRLLGLAGPATGLVRLPLTLGSTSGQAHRGGSQRHAGIQYRGGSQRHAGIQCGQGQPRPALGRARHD